MDLIAHFIIGLVLYRFTGNIFAIPLTVILDFDHFLGFVYDKKKIKFNGLPHIMHLAYRPRTRMHNLIATLLFGVFLSFFMPWKIAFIPLLLHLFFDSLDKSGIYLLPFGPKWKIKGILPVGYLIDKPEDVHKHKRSHIPSLIVMIAGILLLLFYK